jgi:xylose isomerase
MVTPGAHRHYAYGGVASLDPDERKAVEEFGEKTVDLANGALRKAWHPDPSKWPTYIIWNGPMEPKSNEGHPALLIPTVASALVF